MSRESLVRDESARLALALALSGEYLDELLLKLAFLRRIYTVAGAGTAVDVSQIVDILEDDELALDDEQAVDLLTSAGLLTRGDGELTTTDVIRPEHPLIREAGDVAITREQLAELLDGASEAQTGLTELLACLDRTTRWGLHIAAALPDELEGVPCFWDYENGSYRPFNMDPASVTTSDALRLVVERARTGARPLRTDRANRPGEIGLWEKLLTLQRTDSAWNRGAFSVPGEDDDFVGAFDPARPELGPCPTVDATGGAVIALCAAMASASDPDEQLASRSQESVREGIAFLLRCQLAGGGWPLYRYEGDLHPVVERDVSSWYAVEALSEAVRAGVLDDVTCSAGLAAAEAFVALAERSANRDGETAWWVPDFVTVHASDTGHIQATVTVTLALLAARRAWPQLAARVSPLVDSACRFVSDLWRPDPSAMAVVTFRVPTWDGPAMTKFPWEWPLDALAVQMLSDSDAPWDTALAARLSTAVAGFLATEADGHWNDFLMQQQEGKDRAVVGSTILYHCAILAYAKRQLRAATEFFGG